MTLTHCLRIGDKKIGWCKRIDGLAHQKRQLATVCFFQAVQIVGNFLQVAGIDQIGLRNGIKIGVLLPGFIVKAVVTVFGSDHRFCCLTERGKRGVADELPVLESQIGVVPDKF